MCSHAENIHRGDLRQLLCREVAEVLGGIKEDVKQYLAGRASDRFVRSVAA